MNIGSTWGNSSGLNNSNPSGNQVGSTPGNANSPFGAPKPNSAFQFGSNTAGGNLGVLPSLSSGTNHSAAGDLNSSIRSSQTPSQNGGLFGTNSGASGAGKLFGTSNGGDLAVNTQPSHTTSLNSGNNARSASLSGTSSAGLFGNSNASKRPVGFVSSAFPSQSNNQPASFLGISPAQNTTTSNISSSNSAGGLFGASLGHTANTSSGFSGNSLFATKPAQGLSQSSSGHTLQGFTNVSPSVHSTDPYGFNPALAAVSEAGRSIPPSITGTFSNKISSISRKRSHSVSIAKSGEEETSFVSRLAKKFNVFRSGAKKLSLEQPKSDGVFTQQNVVDDFYSPKPTDKKEKKDTQPLSGFFNIGDYKTLMIKSHPPRFCHIDTANVFESKRRRTTDQFRLSGENAVSELNDGSKGSHFSLAVKPIVILESQKKDQVSSDLKDPIPVLETPDGYFCSPTLDDLSLSSPQELRRVKNFIVGRRGHGQISYNFPVDISLVFERCHHSTNAVRREIFGRIIQIDGSTVRVYDADGLVSPEMGQEFNVPATITLKAPHKNRSVEDHIKRLQNMTGMSFVTYDPVTFNWTFTVKHFSVWGLIDDSEPEGDENEALVRLRSMKKKQDRNERKASVIYSTLYQSENYQNELKRQKIGSQSGGIPGSWDLETNAASGEGVLNAKQTLVQNEINQELNAFQEKKYALALASNASDITNDSDDNSIAEVDEGPLLDELFISNEVGNNDYITQIVNGMQVDPEIYEVVDEKAYEPSIENEKIFDLFKRREGQAVSGNWLVQLELANSVESSLAPPSSFWKSPSLALSCVNDVLFSGAGKDPVLPQQRLVKAIDEHHSSQLGQFDAIETVCTAESFKYLISSSDIRKGESGFPKVHFKRPLTFAFIGTIFERNINHKMIEFASILFDDCDIESSAEDSQTGFKNSFSKRLHQLERRGRLASWFRSYNECPARTAKTDLLDAVFSQLCLGNIKAAVEIAMVSNNSHLASLLTLIDSNDKTVKSIASEQLEVLKRTHTTNGIHEAILKIYGLLAGNFDCFQDELTTRDLFGLRIFYGSHAETIETIISKLPQSTDPCGVSEMLKVYYALQVNGMDQAAREIQDSQLSNLLKWLLVVVISSSCLSAEVCGVQDSVAVALGSDLESLNLWKEALYVYSTMADENALTDKIRHVVVNNVREISRVDAQNEKFLTDVLKIPETLLHEARAIDKREKGDLWGSGEALVNACLWQEAHDLICSELGPIAAIEEDFTLITRLRGIVLKFPEQGSIISRWNQGAGFYVEYFDILEKAENLNPVQNTKIEYLLANGANLQISESLTLTYAFKVIVRRIGEICIENCENIPHLRQKLFALASGENEVTYLSARLESAGVY